MSHQEFLPFSEFPSNWIESAPWVVVKMKDGRQLLAIPMKAEVNGVSTNELLYFNVINIGYLPVRDMVGWKYQSDKTQIIWKPQNDTTQENQTKENTTKESTI